MIGCLFKLLFVYLFIMAIFHFLTMFIAYVSSRQVFANPDFKNDVVTKYPGGILKAFWSEFWSVSWLYLSWPFGLINRDMNINKDKTDEMPPVLFIHGWTENRHHWNWMINRLTNEKLRRLYTVRIHPQTAPIEHFREQVAKKIDDILVQSKHEKLTIVGHSIGGIVARDYMRTYGSQRVERVITMGAPHRGTLLGNVAPFTPAKQLESDSAFLTLLAKEEDLSNVDMHCIATVHDNIVVPFDSAFMENSTNHLLYGHGHTGTILCEESLRIVRTLLFSRPVKEEKKEAPEKTVKKTETKAKTVTKKPAAKKPATKKTAAKKAPAKKAKASDTKTKKSTAKPKAKTAAKKTSKEAIKDNVKAELTKKIKEK